MRTLPLLSTLLLGCPVPTRFTQQIDVLVPDGSDPFEGAATVTLTVRYADREPLVRELDPSGEVRVEGLEPGAATLEIVASDGDGAPIALGRSMPLSLGPEGGDAAVFVAPADSIVALPGGLANRRAWAQAAATPGGRVVVVGGGDNESDSVDRTEFLGWDPTRPLTGVSGARVDRIGHGVALIPEGQGDWGGQLAVIGGTRGTGDHTLTGGWEQAWRTVSLIDPVSGEVVAAAPELGAGYMDVRLFTLDDGRLAIVGGFALETDPVQGDTVVYTAELRLLDPADGSDTPGPALGAGGLREQHTVATLSSFGFRFALASGGLRATNALEVLDSAFLWDGDPGSTVELLGGDDGMTQARARHSATDLGEGRALIAGGAFELDDFDAVGTALSSLEVFDLDDRSFELLPVSLLQPRQRHVAVGIPGQRVLICGGQGADGMPIGSCEVYDDSTPGGAVTEFAGGSMAPGGPGVAAVPLPDGRVVFVGGASQFGADDTVHLYTPPAFTD